jgi:hypothetical protein
MPEAEVSSHIIVDEVNENIHKRILESLDKISGITTRSFTIEVR